MRRLMRALFELILVLMVTAGLAAEKDTVDAFGRFYLQARKSYYDAQDAPSEERLAILAQVKREGDMSTESPYREGALVWVAQEYSTNGRTGEAIVMLAAIREATLSPNIRDVAAFELGLAYSRAGKPLKAEKTWQQMLNDTKAGQLRSMAAEHLRSSQMVRGEWEAARRTAELELSTGLGSPPVLYETMARCCRRAGSYKEAERYYRRLLDEYPDYRPKNRMIYLDKAAATCKYEGCRESIPYLEEMEAIVARYEEYAQAHNLRFAEVCQEHYNLGNGYWVAASAYRQRKEAMPIPDEETLERALKHYFSAIEGLKELLPETKSNIAFESVVDGCYRSAASILAEMDKTTEAQKLLEELLRLYPDIDPARLASAQDQLNALFKKRFGTGVQASRLIANDIPDDPDVADVPDILSMPGHGQDDHVVAIARTEVPLQVTSAANGRRNGLCKIAFSMAVVLLFLFFGAWLVRRRKST